MRARHAPRTGAATRCARSRAQYPTLARFAQKVREVREDKYRSKVLSSGWGTFLRSCRPAGSVMGWDEGAVEEGVVPGMGLASTAVAVAQHEELRVSGPTAAAALQ